MKENTLSKSRNGGCLFSLVKLGFLAAVVLLVALYFCAGYIADYAIKAATAGTEITGGIGGVKIRPFDESIAITDFYITNPAKKYKKECAVKFKYALVDLDIQPTTFLSKNVVIIDEINIDGLELNYEASSDNALTSSNINDIITIVENNLGIANKPETKTATTTTQPDTTKKEPMKFIIKKLSFKNGSVTSSVLGNIAESQLPDFVIENIGTDAGGYTAAQVAATVVPQVVAQATQHILKGGWKASVKTGGDTVNELKNIFNNIVGGQKKQSAPQQPSKK